MPSDSQDLACGAMPSQSASAPVALPARQIDLADDAPSQQIPVIRRHDFSDEFMARRSRKTVVTAKQLQICVADSGAEESDHRLTLSGRGTGRFADRRAMFLEVDGNHVA